MLLHTAQDGSPTAASNGASSASTASKSGGNGFQPPAGRFPSDPVHTNGQWNQRQAPNALGYPPSRTQVPGLSGTADGITNYGSGALNRRSNTPGKPPVAGACGLVNLGNTCYLNSAVQCLSHTPLMRAYILSDMWVAEVNKYNPLGTQVSFNTSFSHTCSSD